MTTHFHSHQEPIRLTAPKVLSDVQMTAPSLQNSSYTPRHHDQMGLRQDSMRGSEC